MPRSKKTMPKNNTANVAAELGLDDATPATAPTTAPAAEAPAKEAVKTREAVKVGNITTVKFSSIPGITRKGGNAGGETKYNFTSLAAPEATGDAENPYNYDVRVIEYDPSEDEVRFARSIQTAYTKANKDAKDAGKKTHFIGRKFYHEDGELEGKLAGLYVFRVDDTVADEDDAPAA